MRNLALFQETFVGQTMHRRDASEFAKGRENVDVGERLVCVGSNVVNSRVPLVLSVERHVREHWHIVLLRIVLPAIRKAEHLVQLSFSLDRLSGVKITLSGQALERE
jgi:hypothetical protein